VLVVFAALVVVFAHPNAGNHPNALKAQDLEEEEKGKDCLCRIEADANLHFLKPSACRVTKGKWRSCQKSKTCAKKVGKLLPIGASVVNVKKTSSNLSALPKCKMLMTLSKLLNFRFLVTDPVFVNVNQLPMLAAFDWNVRQHLKISGVGANSVTHMVTVVDPLFPASTVHVAAKVPKSFCENLQEFGKVKAAAGPAFSEAQWMKQQAGGIDKAVKLWIKGAGLNSFKDKALDFVVELQAHLQVQRYFFEVMKGNPDKLPVAQILGFALFEQHEPYEDSLKTLSDSKYHCSVPAILMSPLDYTWIDLCGMKAKVVSCAKLRRSKLGNADNLKRYFIELVEGLQIIHMSGIPHLDLVAKNVMLSAPPAVRTVIIDLGAHADQNAFGPGAAYSPQDPSWPRSRSAANANANFDLRWLDLFSIASFIEDYIMGSAEVGYGLGNPIRNQDNGWREVVNTLHTLPTRDWGLITNKDARLDVIYRNLLSDIKRLTIEIPDDHWID